MGDRDRRLAAVWFCDVVGSSEIAAELGDRPFRWLIGRSLAVARSAARRHGGREIDTAGDGMFAIFDAPAAALRAGTEVSAAVRDLGLEVRSGVHLGEVEHDPDGSVGGIAVHIGARVASLAAAGEVLTTASTGDLASGAGFRFEERGAHRLKGIAGNHAVVAVVEVDGEPLGRPLDPNEAALRRAAASAVARSLAPGASPTATGRPPEARPFVGRDRELDELRLALADAAGGRGSLILICGEPGIGKSRLIEEVVGHATAHGWEVMVGRCWEGGGAPAYWPWVQIVRAAGGTFERLAQIPEADNGGSRPSAAAESIDPEAARFRLFDQVGRFLSDAASDRPCLVVLDDLHAADEPSLLVLRFVATMVAERPVVLLGSYREGDPQVHEMAELFGDLSRLGRRIPLRGLTEDDVAAYIALVIGDDPSERVATRLRDVTGGNPFFLGEVVRTLAAEGRLDTDDPSMLRLPEEVRALIRRRLAGLSKEAQSTLRVAAVVGREFDLRVVSATSTLSLDRLIDVVGEAVDAGLLTEHPEMPGTYAFAHDLMRDTLYEDLPAARRLELHRTVAHALEEIFHEDLEPHLAEIAHHFSLAATLGDAAPAVDYSVRAANQASAVLAFEDAARLYERALHLLPSGGAASPGGGEILVRLGHVRSRAGDTDDARRAFGQAAEIARRTSDPELLSEAALGYSSVVEPVRLGLGGLLITSALEPGTIGIALLEESLQALPEGDGSLRARTLARLASELYTTDQTDRRLALSAEAVDMALRLGDPAALVAALHGRHWATFGPDTVHERLENAQQMLLAATAAGEQEAAFLARQPRMHCFLEIGDVAGVDAELDAMGELANKIRQPYYVWHATSLRAMRALLGGRLAEAERHVSESLTVPGLRETEYVTYMVENALMLGIRWTQGRLGEVVEVIRSHAERYPGIPRWRDALAAAEVGDAAAARAEVERHARYAFAGLPRDGLWILHACALAQAAVLIRDERRAAELYDLLAPYAERNAISVSTVPFGPVATRLGMLASLLGRWEEAERHFELAMARCDAMGARAIEAIVLVEHARMLTVRRGSGDREHARELLERAGSICEELEMPGILERVRELRAAPAPRLPAATFRREGQYWTVAFGTEMARLHDLKGLAYIATLLAAPGREVHVVELAGSPGGGDAAEDLGTTRLDPAEPVLDRRAKDEYRRRLAELAEDREEARAWNDPERAAKTEREIDAINAELERALGLGGRDRGMPSPAERARVNVTKAIRAAIRAIGSECPRLGEHLAASIRTGRFCSYAPPGHEPPAWRLVGTDVPPGFTPSG